MEFSQLLQALFRWIHIVAGILWIGLLYWFNFVNLPFAATLDTDGKKKVFPELLPRALYWFRWGAAFSFFSGMILLMLVIHMGGAMFEEGVNWTIGSYVMLAVVYLGVFINGYTSSSSSKACPHFQSDTGILHISAPPISISPLAGST